MNVFRNHKKYIYIFLLVGVLVYLPVFFNGFVWDDKEFIVNNYSRHHYNLFSLFGPNQFNDGRFYRPIPAIYFAALYSLFGQQAFFYHLLQIILHIMNTVLLYFTFGYLFGIIDANIKEKKWKEWSILSGSQKIKFQRKHGSIVNASYVLQQRKTTLISLFLSLIFLIHPINVESVAWIASTTSELFFLFGILAFYLAREKQISKTRFLLITCLLFLSMLTKETGLLFIPLIICYRFLFLDNRRQIFSHVIGGAVITGIYLAIRFFIGGVVYHNIRQEIPIASLSLAERMLTMPAILVYYLQTFLYPAKLVIWQSWIVKSTADANFIVPLMISLLFFLILFSLGVWLYKRERVHFKLFLFFAFWYGVGMSNILQLVPLEMTVSDRWFYIPIIGLLGMLGIGLQYIVKNEAANKAVVACCVIILLFLSIRTVVRNTNYYNDMTLFTHDSRVLDNTFIENKLGSEYFSAQDFTEALKHFQKSNELQPTNLNQLNLSHTYYVLRNLAKGRLYASKLLNIDINDYTIDNYDGAVVNASAYILNYDSPQYASEFIISALKKDPNSIGLWGNLAIAKNILGDRNGALEAAKKTRTLYPNKRTDYLYDLTSQGQSIPKSMIFTR